MKTLRFNHTNLEVSNLCLGAGPFGTSLPKEQAFEQMDAFVAQGGNFIDTAHVYGDWAPGTKALSEKVIGEWIEQRSCREKIILSTKGGHPLLASMDVTRVLIDELEIDLQGSLESLRTGMIDLYFLHRDNPQLPVTEIIEWLEAQKAAGRIRYYGCSNWSLERIIQAQDYARSKGWDGFTCNQIQDSLADSNRILTDRLQMVVADRAFDRLHRASGMNLMAYMAVAHGYFTKKAAELPLSEMVKHLYDLPQNQRMLEVMQGLPEYSVNDFNYQYILQRPYPSIPITAFSSIAQMMEAIQCCSKEMPLELLERVSALKE